MRQMLAGLGQSATAFTTGDEAALKVGGERAVVGGHGLGEAKAMGQSAIEALQDFAA